MIRISHASLFVEDQAKALAFYTDVVGFTKRADQPLGADRWLTVVSDDGPDATELVLEPNGNPIAKTYQQALFEAGIPATTFASSDIHADYERMTTLGVTFRQEPTAMGPVISALFEDTCGNLIGMHQVVG